MTNYVRKTKIERKTEICNAGITVFMKKGYRNTTMEDIIELTSLSKGGVYRYYKSTRDILMDVMRIGNNYRISILKNIHDNFNDKLDVKDKFLEYAVNKIYDYKPYMDLYAMFLSEIIYDDEVKKLFYEIEKETLDISIDVLAPNATEKEIEDLKSKYIFISRIINGLIFIDHIFREQEVLLMNKEKVIEILKIIIE